MLRRIILPLLCLVLLLPACKEEPEIPAELKAINKAIESDKPGIYYMLQDYKPKARRQPEAVRMYYDYLTIKYEDQISFRHPSDSLIKGIVHYYEKKNDRRMLPEVYYLAGRVYASFGDALRGLDYYQQALDASAAQGNEKLMQRIYFQMGHIFLHQDVYDEALNAQRKALGYKHLAVDSVSEVFILKDLGATYAAQGKTDSAFLYYQEALWKAETACNASVRFYVKEDMAALHLRLGEYDKAWRLLDAPPADMDASVQATLYRLKAQLFHRTGQPDSALYYCRLLTREGSSVYDRQAASLEMAGIFTGQGRFQDAVNQYCQYVTYTDSVQKLIRTAAISKAQSTYNYRLRERENNQLKLKNAEQRTLILVYLLAGVLITGGGTVYLLHLRTSRQKQNERIKELERQQEEQYTRSRAYIEQNNAVIRQLETRLASTSADNTRMRERLQTQQEQLRQRNIRAEAEMRQQELALHTFRQSDIYIRFHQATDFSELSETDWQELQRTIDETFNRFTARLYALSPLNERELRICLLVKAEIQPTGIAQLTGRVKSTITSARKNLFEKLYGKKGSAEDFDRFIRAF
ncbi:MAG TPA: tetratricopeptide repeat protein [Candidatus Phocaeicola caecigallinarum]|nr:tetratricopeptide repeat protein [Candidatus Phocaeicola caecigallinarum]